MTEDDELNVAVDLDPGPMPISAVQEVGGLPWRWKMLDHMFMSKTDPDVVGLIGYAQVHEIVSQAVVDLEAAYTTAQNAERF